MAGIHRSAAEVQRSLLAPHVQGGVCPVGAGEVGGSLVTVSAGVGDDVGLRSLPRNYTQ